MRTDKQKATMRRAAEIACLIDVDTAAESGDPFEMLELLVTKMFKMRNDAQVISKYAARIQAQFLPPTAPRPSEGLPPPFAVCGVRGCNNPATHTWSGHPTCDECGRRGTT